MKNVCICIPSELFNQLYNQYGEQTGHQIITVLQELVDQSNSLSSQPASTSFRPRDPKSITGRVWGIADRIKAEKGVANREDVVGECMAEGIKMNTASTQYSQWKKENM